MEIVNNKDSTQSTSQELTNTVREMLSEQPKEKEPEWPKLIDRVLLHMELDGIDQGLPHFERLFAKIATRELKTPTSQFPQGVLLFGGTGNGKTRRLRFMEKHLSGMHMASAVDIIAKLEKKDDVEYFREVTRTDIGSLDIVPKRYYDLIIDDIGCEKTESSTFGNKRDIMEQVITARYNVFPEHQTHFSTNLSEELLLERYGQRVFSRLKEMCVFVRMNGIDRRTGK